MEKSRRCDGLDDCQDESDEVFCGKLSCMLNNTGCLSEHFACGISRALEKLLHIFTARPTKNCAGNSPLHPLFVCNGEADCANGIDEINCTQGMIIS